ncbi:phosphomannomutase [Candidatus Dependentiae bacterium Noda2021]|nr:phosphomannomutase [Candidatus Dependentiae bacterium Noda2021]
MRDAIFREYDIRGIVGTDFLVEEVYDLARAISLYFKTQAPSTSVVAVGMDGRLHSPAIKEQLVKGLNDSGLDVVFVGVCPSPALYFSLFTMPVDAGIMITASHNPKEYNGFKILLGKNNVWGSELKVIRDYYKEKKSVDSTRRGALCEKLVIPSYISWLADHFSHLKNMNIKAIIDCGNAAGGTVVPLLIEAMNWKFVDPLCSDVDGNYPNHEADPCVEKNMQDVKERMLTGVYDVGIGLDGDCDRMVPMTPSGYLVPGDKLFALYSQDVLQKHPGAGIVVDIKSSSGLLELLEQWKAQVTISPSGHAIIKDRMKKYNALLAGELSCHFFFADSYFGYDDGIYAFMRLFDIMQKTGKSLEELLIVFPQKFSSIEIRLTCAENKKQEIIHEIAQAFSKLPDVTLITVDGVRASLPYGWGIVRASNTQDVLSMRFESDSPEGLALIKKDFATILSRYYNNALLQQHFN